MFVVKLKYKDSNEIMYSNESIIRERDDVRKGDNFPVSWFCMPLHKAKELYKELISRDGQHGGWYGEKLLDFISIVELSNYEPHPEYQVIDYREFK
jgi:hypothetical protein